MPKQMPGLWICEVCRSEYKSQIDAANCETRGSSTGPKFAVGQKGVASLPSDQRYQLSIRYILGDIVEQKIAPHPRLWTHIWIYKVKCTEKVYLRKGGTKTFTRHVWMEEARMDKLLDLYRTNPAEA